MDTRARLIDLATRVAAEFKAVRAEQSGAFKSATVQLGSAGALRPVVVVADGDVTPASRVRIWLAPALDTDENCPEFLDLVSATAIAVRNGSFDAEFVSS